MDVLALAPAAGIFGVPSAGAGPCGVVEEQVALRASAAPQPMGFERAQLLDETPGQRPGGRGVGPDQLAPRHPLGHDEFDARGAVGAERVDLSKVQCLAGENRLRDVDCCALKSAQVG